MANEYLPIHKEFGIFMVGWTGAVTIVVASYYIVGNPIEQPRPSLTNIVHDWATGMAVGVTSFAAACVMYAALVTITEMVNDLRGLRRKVMKSVREFVTRGRK